MKLEVVDWVKIVVSGIPRGYHQPRADGNWLTEEHAARITSVAPSIELLEIPPDRIRSTCLDGIDVALVEGGNRTHYDGELDWQDYLELFVPSLRWVQICSTGFGDNITQQIMDGSVVLTNSPGVYTVPLAESVLAAMLEHAKNLRKRIRNQEIRRWSQIPNAELYGQSVLIIGLGRIGLHVARLCKAFGMRVVGVRRSAGLHDCVDLVTTPDQMRAHLARADYLVMALPLTADTKNMLTAEDFRLMKHSAYVINIGRGMTVDEDALLEALQLGEIAGAYLDVFSEEPLPAGHAFWGMNNVFVVPHDSHSSPLIGDRLVDMFCDNLRRYVAGLPLCNRCDPSRGY